MVQQLRMRRLVPEATEVVDGADEPAAEDVMPEPVDHHACGQRIIGRGDLVGEFPAAAPSGHEGFGVEDLEVATRHGTRRLLVFPAHEERHIEALGFQEARGAARLGELGLELAVFGGQGGELG